MASSDELSMTAHALAGKAPAMYLERAGSLYIYEGDADDITTPSSSRFESDSVVGGTPVDSYSYESRYRIKLFDPASFSGTYRETLPPGPAPEETKVVLLTPDQRERPLAGKIQDGALVIPVSDATPGSVLLVSYTVRGKDPTKIHSWAFQGRYPSLVSSLSIHAHHARDIQFGIYSANGAQLGPARVVETPDRMLMPNRTYSWKLESVPATPDGTPGAEVVIERVGRRRQVGH